jgi:hypothetical protein
MRIANSNNQVGQFGGIKNPSIKILKECYLVVKIENDDGRIKATLSQNAIPFKEISIYSIEES